jgi:hypothetical protein
VYLPAVSSFSNAEYTASIVMAIFEESLWLSPVMVHVAVRL